MSLKALTVFVIFLGNLRICQSVRYDNFTLFNVMPIEPDHLKFLQNIETQKYMDVKFWNKPLRLHENVQFLVNPTDIDIFNERAYHFRLPADILIEDVQKAFDNQSVSRYLRLRPETFGWEHYYGLEDIYQWLNDVAARYPTEVEIETIGKSAEGRDIYAIAVKKKLTAHANVIVEGGIHGNEWISTAFVTYLIDRLLHVNETDNYALRKIAKNYHWYLIPVVNPDGYTYSHKHDRLWRKNRRSLPEGAMGVDLNRNFDYYFGRYGTSHDFRDSYYCGQGPFSEPESRALADFIDRKRSNLKFYFAIHGYGQKIIIPFGDKKQHADNYLEMENYAKQAIIKIYNKYHTRYAVGNAYDTLGEQISGDSASWVKHNFKVRYVFTFLLRDNGTYGYALPADSILPTCEETLSGLIELMTCNVRYVNVEMFSSSSKIEAGMLIVLMTLLMLK